MKKLLELVGVSFFTDSERAEIEAAYRQDIESARIEGIRLGFEAARANYNVHDSFPVEPSRNLCDLMRSSDGFRLEYKDFEDYQRRQKQKKGEN